MTMERCCFGTWLVLVLVSCVLIPSVLGQDCSPDRLNVPRFGKNCQYRCRCQDDRQCNNVTGSCCADDGKGPECQFSNGCAREWMGPSCQYRNVAGNRTRSRLYGASSDGRGSWNAVDGNTSSCTMSDVSNGQGNQSWTIELDRSYYIYGLVITIPPDHTDRFKSFKIYKLVQFKGGIEYLVYQHPHKPGSTKMEIMLKEPEYIGCVRIELGVPNKALSLCEVEIYAGRYLSYRKATEQTSTYTQWISSNAVDGSIPTKLVPSDSDLEKTCASVIGGDPKMWSVNLTKVFQITAVQIWARPSHIVQIQGIQVLTMFNSSARETIYSDIPNNDIKSYVPKLIELTKPKPCESLRIERHSISDALVLCEVEIYGECDLGLCGWDCNDTCHCNSITTGSYRLNGTCPYGCEGRWTGMHDRCDTECRMDQWGQKCHKSCGHCLNSNACDVIFGKCPSGCDIGWRNTNCDESCTNSTYGQNCSLLCGHCKDFAECDAFKGTCNQGCEAGWTGELCNEACADGWYGPQCSETCGQCLESTTCDHVTGVCSNGCSAGYEGDTCKNVCAPGSFGLQCSESCGHCLETIACNHVTGICGDRCLAGYEGEKCNKECPQFTYGQRCQGRCGVCKGNQSCNVTSGLCHDGCEPGYYGKLCRPGEGKRVSSSCSTNESQPISSLAGGIIGFLVVLTICFVIATVLLVVCYRRKLAKYKAELSNVHIYAQYNPNTSNNDQPQYEALQTGVAAETEQSTDDYVNI